MNIIRQAWEWLYPPTAKLRNKPGGMAWIRGLCDGDPATLNNRAVKTVRADGVMWVIDPPQLFTATHTTVFRSGRVVRAGNIACVYEVRDDRLEPWKETGLTTEEISTLYAPSEEEVTPAIVEPAESLSSKARAR